MHITCAPPPQKKNSLYVRAIFFSHFLSLLFYKVCPCQNCVFIWQVNRCLINFWYILLLFLLTAVVDLLIESRFGRDWKVPSCKVTGDYHQLLFSTFDDRAGQIQQREDKVDQEEPAKHQLRGWENGENRIRISLLL